MNTQDKQTIKELKGYLCLDTNGEVWFFDRCPVCEIRTFKTIDVFGNIIDLRSSISWNNRDGKKNLFMGFEIDLETGMDVNKVYIATLKLSFQ